ncbi:MAG: endonuclease III [Candidatus Omnitrophica bacterium]|nr:endonuclease III [Candidatus Omnitrophota bacterium]
MRSPACVIKALSKQVKPFIIPSVTVVSHEGNDPFKVLVSCLLSLRTKDQTTIEASRRLFTVAADPERMLQLSAKRIERLIYPVGFYRRKAAVIRALCRRLVAEHGGRVPGTRDELLKFKGVGRKTANLVMGLGFSKPAICVDTHVHRISNRIGWVKTRTPDETEQALENVLPRRYWIMINTLLVTFGQNICLPVSPWCSRCSLSRQCPRRGVKRSR